MNTKKIIVPVIVAVALALPAASCKKGPAGGQAEAPEAAFDRSKIMFPVETQPVALRSLVYTVNAVGSVDAFEKVQVTARVSGVVDRVLFAEGNLARVDQVLVEIEPERYTPGRRVRPGLLREGRRLAGRRRGRPQAPRDRHRTEPGPHPRRRSRDLADPGGRGQVRRGPDEGRPQPGQAQPPRRLRPGAVRRDPPDPDGPDRSSTSRPEPSWRRSSGAIPCSSGSRSPSATPPGSGPGMKADFRVRNSEAQFAAKIVHVAESADDATRMVAVTAEVEDTGTRPCGPEPSPRSRSRSAASARPRSSRRRPSGRASAASSPTSSRTIRRRSASSSSACGPPTARSRSSAGLKPGERLVVRGAEALRDGAPVKRPPRRPRSRPPPTGRCPGRTRPERPGDQP